MHQEVRIAGSYHVADRVTPTTAEAGDVAMFMFVVIAYCFMAWHLK